MTDIVTTGQGGTLSTEEELELLKGSAQHTQKFKPDEKAPPPWLSIVQSGSEALKNGEPGYNPQAREGDLTETLTHRLRKSVLFVPVHYEMNYTEWKPNRGGLLKQWFTDDSKYKASKGDFGTRTTEEGNDIVPQHVYYGLAVDEDGICIETLIGMKGTDAKMARAWNRLIDIAEEPDGQGGAIKPPIYWIAYLVSTVRAKNDQGMWMAWHVDPAGKTLKVPNGRTLFARAKDFRERIDRGEVRAVLTPTEQATQTQERATARPGDSEDDIPF